ncbi:MAG TPA: hypothetical protein VM866_02865 [Pyrinomonadaceae bacterium]|nr:hypothetical protein [Pyrinomonadaceae bacterium]
MCPDVESFVAVTPPALPQPALPQPALPSALRQSEGNSFVKPPSFSYRLMPDVTGAPHGAPARRAVRPLPFVYRR